MYSINDNNRDLVIERYVTDIVGGLNFLENKEMLKEILLQQKHQLSNDELEFEIHKNDPQVLTDLYVEEFIEEVEYAKSL